MPRKKTNPAYNYFDIDYTTRTSVCKLCDKRLHTVEGNNLSVHLKKKHTEEYAFLEAKRRGEDSLLEDANQSNPNEEEICEVSSMFEKDTSGMITMAKCLICDNIMLYKASAMEEHLAESHSEIVTHEQYLDTEEEVNIKPEVMYLENAGKKRKNFYDEIRRESQKYNANKQRKTVANTLMDSEIDSFSAYLSSLLRQIPRESCSQLQIDILNMVMNEKIRCENKSDVNNDVKNPILDTSTGQA